MLEWMITFIENFGYFAVCFLIAIENLFPPIPSEVILTFTGFFVTTSNLNIFVAIFFATLGSLIGAIILYYIGNIFSKDKLSSFITNKGKWLHIKVEHIEKAFSSFDHYGSYTVFFMRFVPVIRSFISIPAGMAKMSIIKFLLLTCIGSLIWNSILIYLGYYAQEHYQKIAENFESYLLYIILFVILFLLLILLIKKISKKQSQY